MVTPTRHETNALFEQVAELLIPGPAAADTDGAADALAERPDRRRLLIKREIGEGEGRELVGIEALTPLIAEVIRVSRATEALSGSGGGDRPSRPRAETRRRDLPPPDLVDRKFAAEALSQLRVADITFVPTAAGFHDLAVVLDA